MAISAVAAKPDDAGGRYPVYFYADHTANSGTGPNGQPSRRFVGRQILGMVRQEMAGLGISEEGWTPE